MIKIKKPGWLLLGPQVRVYELSLASLKLESSGILGKSLKQNEEEEVLPTEEYKTIQ